MSPSNASDFHLVHANVAHARAPLDSPLMADFMAQVEEINSSVAVRLGSSRSRSSPMKAPSSLRPFC